LNISNDKAYIYENIVFLNSKLKQLEEHVAGKDMTLL